jgi:hypothetical protein
VIAEPHQQGRREREQTDRREDDDAEDRGAVAAEAAPEQLPGCAEQGLGTDLWFSSFADDQAYTSADQRVCSSTIATDARDGSSLRPRGRPMVWLGGRVSSA